MEDFVKRLARLDTCAVSDAMDKLGLSGAASGLAQRAGQGRIAGRVMTYSMAAHQGGAETAASVRHLGTTAIERAQPGDVVVAEQRTGIDAACWGGILTLGAKLKGIAGVIAEGPVRDVDEAVAHGFPVFSRAVTSRTARGRIVEASTGEPVTVGDIRVCAGDYVIADLSGVVFVRAADMERVLEAAESLFAREAAIARALLGGAAITEVMGAKYENMLQRQPKAADRGEP